MGFDIRSESNNENQLSLLDFQMSQSQFEEGSSAVDYDTWILAHQEPETSKAGRFLTMSVAIHLAGILAVAMMTVPLVEQANVETITFEIEDVQQPLPKGFQTLATQGGPKSEPVIALPPKEVAPAPEVASADDIVVAKPKAASQTKAAPVKAAKANPVKTAPAKSTVAAKTEFKALPATIDDLDAPELDNGALAAATVKSSFEEDFNDDFSRVDQNQKTALQNEQDQLNTMAATLASEQEESLDALNEENQALANEMAEASAALKARNAQAIAAAEAAERAAAAHRAEEDRARAAAQAAALARAAQGGGSGNGQGQGAGNSGSPTRNSKVAGVPNGVRSLDQLRQRPGNPHPQYSREERRAGHFGSVAYLAYISREGIPTQFRMVKSTGYQNLDMKTLEALKQWRFYPGQEGWVELPFNWDLKGGPQEDGGLLRRAVSRR